MDDGGHLAECAQGIFQETMVITTANQSDAWQAPRLGFSLGSFHGKAFGSSGSSMRSSVDGSPSLAVALGRLVGLVSSNGVFQKPYQARKARVLV